METLNPDTAFTFPELLAQDLELSISAFTSKNMTAGCPRLGLATEGASQTQKEHGESGNFGFSSGDNGDIRGLPNKMTALESIGEAGSPLPIPEDDDDVVSTTSSDSSLWIEPASVRTRQQSVATAATSVGSQFGSFSSHRDSSPDAPTTSRVGESWVDLDSSGIRMKSHRRFSAEGTRRLPRPISSTGIIEPVSPQSMVMGSPTSVSDADVSSGTHTPFHLPYAGPERPHTSSGHPSHERARLADIPIPIPIPKRRSSLSNQHGQTFLAAPGVMRAGGTSSSDVQPVLAQHLDETVSSEPREIMAHANSRTWSTQNVSTTLTDATIPALDQTSHRDHQVTKTYETPLSSFRLKGDEGSVQSRHAVYYEPSARPESHSQYIEPSAKPEEHSQYTESWARPPAHPNMHMYSWRSGNDSMSGHSISKLRRDSGATGVPLPPEVYETIRVSVSCFPDVMLTTSTLSIETIRTYSGKLRRARANSADDADSLLSASDSDAPAPRRWGLHKLLPSRRPQLPSPTSAWDREIAYAPLRKISLTASNANCPLPQANLEAIKNIFPRGSDLLCDSLYAHLIVYNYVKSLLSRNGHDTGAAHAAGESTAAARSRSSTMASGYTRQEDARRIPSKAATLLGLSDGSAADPTAASLRSRRQLFRKRLMAEQDPFLLASRSSEGATPDLLARLTRCIARLVFRLTRDVVNAEGEEEESRAEIDPLLLRTLGELVRCCEEV